MKKCPFCAELIQDEAIKCRYCGSMLTSGDVASSATGAGIWQQQVRGLLADGQKIQAIKLVRQQTSCGLKDAKDFVEAMERGQSPSVPQPAAKPPQTTGCAVLFAVLLAIAAVVLTYFIRR